MSEYLPLKLRPQEGVKLLNKINSSDLPYCLTQKGPPVQSEQSLYQAIFVVVIDGTETVHNLVLFSDGTWAMDSMLEV